MMKMFTKILLLVLCAVLLYSCSENSANPSPVKSQYEIEIDKLCDTILKNSVIPGIIVGVWNKEKNLSYLKAFGYNNPITKEPMSVNQKFRIGSNTKSFVTTIILQLIDERKLKLDTKMSEFYPDFPNADKVTILQLCNMSSGIKNYTMTSEFDDLFMAEPLHKWTLDEILTITSKYDYDFEPGTGWNYSNTNTQILGGIIETLTGKSLASNLKERIFNKYNLTNTSYPDNNIMTQPATLGWVIPDVATGYFNCSEYWDLSWGGAAGAIISDIYDVKTWITNLIDGGLTSDSLQTKRFQGIKLSNDNDYYYGIGIYTYGNGMWGHNGGLPGYTSIMMRDKSRDYTVIIFFNYDHEYVTPDALFLAIDDILYPKSKISEKRKDFSVKNKVRF